MCSLLGHLDIRYLRATVFDNWQGGLSCDALHRHSVTELAALGVSAPESRRHQDSNPRSSRPQEFLIH